MYVYEGYAAGQKYGQGDAAMGSNDELLRYNHYGQQRHASDDGQIQVFSRLGGAVSESENDDEPRHHSRVSLVKSRVQHDSDSEQNGVNSNSKNFAQVSRGSATTRGQSGSMGEITQENSESENGGNVKDIEFGMFAEVSGMCCVTLCARACMYMHLNVGLKK